MMALANKDRLANAPVVAIRFGTLAIAPESSYLFFQHSHRAGRSRFFALGEVTSLCLSQSFKQRSFTESLALSGMLFAEVKITLYRDKMEQLPLLSSSVLACQMAMS